MISEDKNQDISRLKFWGVSLLVAAPLAIIGYKTPTIWLTICATIWIGYVASLLTSPLLIAFMQSPSFAKSVKRALNILGNLAVAALLSAPIVLFHWYSVTR